VARRFGVKMRCFGVGGRGGGGAWMDYWVLAG
jgi:hypothetical protein